MLEKQTLMQKYIADSPRETESYLINALDDNSVKLIRKMAAKQPVILTGCGTSYHLALLGARYLQSVALIDARAIPSFDLTWYQPEFAEGKIVIAISQSGASKATRDAIAKVKQHNAYVVSITGSDETPMALESDIHLVLPGGRETALPKTRVYTTGAVQLLRLAFETRKLSDSQILDPFPKPEDLRSAMEQVLAENRETINLAATEWNKYEMFTFVGGGPAWVLACESALKMRENNYTFAEGYEVEEFAHGRTCSFAQDRPFIAFAFKGPSVERIYDVISNARYLNAPTMSIVEDGVDSLPEVDYTLAIPSMPSEFTTAIVAGLPMQLFSHQFTLIRGIDPDTIRMDQPDFKFAHKKWIFPPGTH